MLMTVNENALNAMANSRFNARLPYIFLLPRIVHFMKLIQREKVGSIKYWRLLGQELNTRGRDQVSKMTVPDDSYSEDNPAFFRVELFAVPHFQVKNMDVSLSLVSQMPKTKA